VVAELLAAALICLDPGHGTPPSIGAQREPIGPGSPVLKIKDGGGAPGEAAVVLEVARRLATVLRTRGYRVALTRTGPVFSLGGGGNIARAEFCNARRAALMLRIHADGSASSAERGVSALYPARRHGWTDDVYGPSRRAAGLVQAALVRATGARDRGLSRRSDLTGFNWADVPLVLVEIGFPSNPDERRALHTAAYQQRVALGLADGVAAFAGSR